MKLFNLLLFSFFLSTQIHSATYEDAEPTNDSCPGENLSTIVSGTTTFSGVLEKATGGLPGIDYSQMSIPSDGNLSIRWTSAGKTASFLVGSSCNDASYYDGSSSSGTHNTSTFSVNQGDIIYLKIYNGAGGNNDNREYDIEITYTIDTPSAGSDLEITKIDSNDPVEINEEFYYIIDVLNTGNSTATNVIVSDDLPTGMDMNKTKTDEASGFWTCNQVIQNVTCSHNSDIPSGDTHTIYLHVRAPSSAGVVTNNVEVTDANGSSDTASEETTITAEIPNADNLCYIENTLASGLNDDINASCKLRGNFYYGNIGGQDDCIAQVLVVKDSNVSTDPITELTVTKMYAPGLSSGSAIATGGTVLNAGAKTTLNFESFTSYEEGYVVQVDENWIDDNNLIITDTASDYNPNMNGIALYADYNISNAHHFGRIYACSGVSEGGIEINFSVDAIDTSIGTDAATADQYNASADTSNTGNNIKYIQTMVAASPTRTIEGVHLDTNGNATPYTPTNPDFNFIISPVLINDTCDGGVEPLYEPGTTNPAFIIVPDNAYSATGTIEVPSTVRKNARLQLIAIDPDSLSVEGQECILSSSANGNFAGVPSCANSEVQYSNAFGQDAWDRCAMAGGRPCLSQNNGVADTSDPTYDPNTDSIYVNDYGCYLCTFNVAPVCSTDNFAIRPEKFDMEMSDTHAPNLLRAGEDYGVSLTAKDALDNIPASYTVTNHNFNNDLGTDTTRYFKDGTVDTNNLLHGTSDLDTSTTAYMVSGLSSLSTAQPASAQEIVQVSYDDVGKVELKVYDYIWAAVDNDDTPMDCNSSMHTYICGESNVTFIPHHFGFSELNITNHAGPDSNFTYIADNRGMPSTTPPTRSPMAARLQVKIEALSKDGSITQNFRADDASFPYNDSTLYYENPVDINISVTVPSTGTNSYLYPDANESNVVNSYIGFGRTGLDDNGTRNVLWDESNFPLEFNFQREINEPANPFDVNGSYLQSIKIVSHYEDISDGDVAEITGTRLGDWNNAAAIAACASDEGCVQANAENNATFYYARTRSSKFFYDDIVNPGPVTTPIFIDIYCDLGFTACDAFGIDTVNGHISDADWWLSWDHSKSRGDGNITLTATSNGTVSGPPKPNIDASGGADKTVEVTHTAATLPDIVDIDFVTDDALANYTNAWLIHNPDNPWAPSPFYRVRFIGQSGWAGYGDTGHVVGGTSNIQKNNRLEW